MGRLGARSSPAPRTQVDCRIRRGRSERRTRSRPPPHRLTTASSRFRRPRCTLRSRTKGGWRRGYPSSPGLGRRNLCARKHLLIRLINWLDSRTGTSTDRQNLGLIIRSYLRLRINLRFIQLKLETGTSQLQMIRYTSLWRNHSREEVGRKEEEVDTTFSYISYNRAGFLTFT